MRSLISIHDVMPETLERVQALIDRVREHGHTAITLLVVPGRAWTPEQVRTLAQWHAAGMELAAHGWFHRVDAVRGLYHRIHAALISRDVAEHLARDEDGIVRLMRASAEWFPRNGLPAPATYVPPAWALGRIRRERLRELPYQRVEVLGGLLDTATGRVERLPLAGFEADSRPVAAFLRAWNAHQARRARASGRPLRIGIHPRDGELHLRTDLDRFLAAAEASRCTGDFP
ncbi:polysaccharide deacetylase family protein [Aquisalimonas lutea]|uniref:polysaccharide deacetylase family protein n=1 Tax=Aquisalimonas lutea TaxID=1327750 RepID=UPI0025B4636E|nr:polysaccharide deacetylase family protein [Aquisalimonas lutea]MDN3516437.1 polysaccharide deacetylase family protein [Aquisalimonas lutea]